MTFIDIFIFFALLGLLYLSFTSGILKVLTVLIGMYIGLQLSALTYQLFAGLTASQSADSVTTNQIVWFFALWIVWSIIFGYLAWTVIGTFQLPQWANNLDQLGGLALGVFASVFAML